MGIATTTPSEKLDVAGTINATNFKIGGSQGSDGQVLTSTGSGVQWESVSGGVNGISTFTTTTCITLRGTNPPTIILGNNYGTNAFDDSTVQIYSSDNTVFSASSSNQTGEGGLNIQNASSTTNSMAGITFVNGVKSGTTFGYWRNLSLYTGTSSKSDLVWTTRTAGGTHYEAMRLTTNGNSANVTLDLNGIVDLLNLKVNGAQGTDGQITYQYRYWNSMGRRRRTCYP